MFKSGTDVLPSRNTLNKHGLFQKAVMGVCVPNSHLSYWLGANFSCDEIKQFNSCAILKYHN